MARTCADNLANSFAPPRLGTGRVFRQINEGKLGHASGLELEEFEEALQAPFVRVNFGCAYEGSGEPSQVVEFAVCHVLSFCDPIHLRTPCHGLRPAINAKGATSLALMALRHAIRSI